MLRLPIAIAALCVAVHAQDPAGPSEMDWKIHLEVQSIELPAKTAYALLSQLRDEKQMPEAWKRLETLVETGEAKLGLNLGGQSTDNHEVKLSVGEEIRYPNEPPRVDVVLSKAAAEKPVAPNDNSQDVAYSPDMLVSRNVGLSLEGYLRTSVDGKRLVVSAACSRTWLLRWDEFEIGRLRNNDKIAHKQPRFAFARSETSFGVNSGERVLLSAHPIPEQANQMELVLLHIWTTPRRQIDGK